MSKVSSIGLLAAFLVLTACGDSDVPPVADNQSTSPASVAPDIREQEITYEAEGTVLNGFIAYDAAATAARPGVLIVHEWLGANEYVRERARMLAELGYTAFALDMYGDGKMAAHPDDAQKFMMEVVNNMASAEARFRAADVLLRAHPSTDPGKIAAIGYCFGGGVVLHMARLGADLDAIASFHGSLGTQSPAAPGAIKARLLVANGADDPFVPAAEVLAFRAEMAAAGADMKFVSYPGVLHSFTRRGATEDGERFKMPMRYDETADKDSWSELQTLLTDTFAN
jgi:dienelactone hydrolase